MKIKTLKSRFTCPLCKGDMETTTLSSRDHYCKACRLFLHIWEGHLERGYTVDYTTGGNTTPAALKGLTKETAVLEPTGRRYLRWRDGRWEKA